MLTVLILKNKNLEKPKPTEEHKEIFWGDEQV